MRLRVLAASILILSAWSAAAAQERRPLTVADLWAMERVGSPALSPDGRQVAFTVTRWSMETNKSDSDIWLVPAGGGSEPRRLTWNEGPDSGPVWSPDGRSLLFLSKRGDGPAQLYRLPLADGGEAEPLTDLPVSPSDPRWFPDGKRIAFLVSTWPDLNDDWEKVAERVQEHKDDKVQAKISDTRVVRYWDHYLTDGRVSHLCVLDLETREVTDLMPGFDRLLPIWGAGGSWDLSPDGKEFALTVNSTKPPYTKLNYDIYTLPATGGELTNRTPENPAFDSGPRYTADGSAIVYTRGRRPEIAPDFTRFARHDRKTRRNSGIAENWDGQPGGWELTHDSSAILFHATEAGRNNLYRLALAGGQPELLVRGGVTSGVQPAPDGSYVYAIQHWNMPAELRAGQLGTDGIAELTSFNAERLAELDLGSMEDVRFKGARNEDVQMFVVHPPGFDEKKKWPLMMLIHGGPHGSWTDSFHYRWNMALWAARGTVVTAMNFHGSTGRGQAFAESILGNHAELPFEDIMKGTDFMLRRRYLDPQRIAAGGGSYGGYMTAWVLGHTDRFAALINHAGVYDLMAQFASDWTWGRPNNYGAAPWEDPQRIDRYSPSRYAENFNTPTLILHGEKDYRVPYTQGLNLHQVLTGKGVESRLVVYPNANHWILTPQGAQLWWDEVHGWLERHVGAGGR